jgi:hypothetical protein
MSMLLPMIVYMLSVETVIPERFKDQIGFSWGIILLISIVSFLIHSLIKMNTSFYNCGQLIKDRKSIISNYLKNDLIFDTLAIWGLF